MSWIDTFKQSHSITSLAGDVLGMAAKLRGFGPCPTCGAEKRAGDDKRLPITSDRQGAGWRCWACNEKGDVVDLCARKVLGRGTAQLDAAGWEELRLWALEHRLISDSDGTSDKRRAGAPAKAVQSVGSILGTERPKRSLGKRASASKPGNGDDDGGQLEQQEDATGARLFGWEEGLAERCANSIMDDNPHAKAVRDYLLVHRKLAPATLDAFGIGIYVRDGQPVLNAAGRPYLTIPLTDEHRRVVNVRFRSVPVVGTCPQCQSPFGCQGRKDANGKKIPGCKEYRVCANRPLPLFGAANLTADKATSVIIIEGEFDVMAMHTYGFVVNVVSSTAGAGTWEDSWTDQLEPYDHLIGLYDGDDKGSEGWQAASVKLGTYRCSRAVLPKKDAGDCLAAGVDADEIERAVKNAKPMHGVEVVNVSHFTEDIETLINHPEKLRGTHTGSRKLNEALGGFRPGVIVITGESGQGKTTFATWAMYMQAKMGVGALVTSFEQQPIGTAQKLLRIGVGKDFTMVSRGERRAAMDTMGGYPLYILKHFGNIDPKKLVEVMRYAKRRLSVSMFLIDHLGFLIDPDNDDERKAIQSVMRAIALVAKEMDITIFLVVHPANQGKEVPGRFQRVTMKDLKGASAIRQDSDDVIVVTRENPGWEKGRKVKRPWPQARLFLDKVRSEFGTAGAEVPLPFDAGACTYADEWDETPAGKLGLLVPRVSDHHDRAEREERRAKPDGTPRRRRAKSSVPDNGSGLPPDADEHPDPD